MGPTIHGDHYQPTHRSFLVTLLTSAKSPRRLLGYHWVLLGTSAHNGFLKLLRVSESIDRVKGTLSYFGSSTPSHDYYHPVMLVVTESFENLDL